MQNAINTKNPVIQELVKAFTKETVTTTSEIKDEYDFITNNFEGFGSWDIRFKRIFTTALQNDLVVLVRKRGNWKFVVVLDEKTNDLFVFTKKNNIESVIKKFGKGSIHYFHAFVGLNKEIVLGDFQMEIFQKTTDDYENRRIEELRKILGEDYPRVNQVIFIVAEEKNKKIINAEAILYNKFFIELEKTNLYEYIDEEEYSELFVEEESYNDEETLVIPKVKEEIKRSVSTDTIPKEKIIEQLDEYEE